MQLDSILGIEINEEKNQGDNVIATVYFSSDMIDQSEFKDETVAEKGTASGGSIDIFANEEDAIARNDYLKNFDGKWVFDSGGHTVLGTIVIRTSLNFSEEQQNELTTEISEILTSGEISDEDVDKISSKIIDGEILLENINDIDKIFIKYDNSELINKNYQDVKKVLEDQGFTNIKIVAESNNNQNDNDKTKNITINNKTFNKKDKFNTDDEVVIYYSKCEMLTVPDAWYNLVELHYEEVEKLFKQAGFTNIETVAHEVDYNENNTFEGSVVNICIGEDNVTFEANEQFVPSVKVKIDYRIKPKKSDTSDNVTYENPYTELSSYSITYKTEYAHMDYDMIRLGKNEKAWIVIKASPSSLTQEDFFFGYDEEMITISNVTCKKNGENVEIKYEIKGKKSGVSNIEIFSYYEKYEDYENFGYYEIPVKKYNSSDGQIVYVSSSGTKYHLSSSCISSGTKTTLYDALAYEYEPCSKCAK